MTVSRTSRTGNRGTTEPTTTEEVLRLYESMIEGSIVKFHDSPLRFGAAAIDFGDDTWRGGRNLLCVVFTPEQAEAAGIEFVRLTDDDRKHLREGDYDLPRKRDMRKGGAR